ncbi:DEAD/DEAH box helicase family protein [Idiomarina sp.]|uniref:DEAD/DEAH box helicase family protein n=1 Tax=Idiomarina sp. TaxID=1874361 RepID=UPI002EAA1B28|nr:DEAD/DEAH box helicase family protein [Pseudomonadota bacterium]
MKKLSEADLRASFVDPMLKSSGWSPEDILREPVFHNDGQIYRPDYVLSIDSIPVAIIEVKSNANNLEGVKEQVEKYRTKIKTEYSFVVIEKKLYQVNTRSESLEEIKSFPNKEALSYHLKNLVSESKLPKISNLHQMQAISSVFKSINEGLERISVAMSTGSGKHLTQIKIISKILADKSTDLILVIFDRSTLKNQFSKTCEKNGISTEHLNIIKCAVPADRLLLADINDLNLINKNIKPKYVFIEDIHDSNNCREISEQFCSSILIYFSSAQNKEIDVFFGKPVYTYSLTNVIQDEVLTPPNGFETVKLGEIAELRVGKYTKKSAGDTDKQDVSARAVKISDLSNPFRLKNIHKVDVSKSEGGLVKVFSGDILLSRMFHSEPTLVVIDDCDEEHILLPQSIVLIRVTDTSISPLDVFNFLNSDIGKRSLALYTNFGSTIQKSFSLKQLQEIGIFIPTGETSDDVGLELSTARKTIQEIKENVLPLLEYVERSYSSPDGVEESQLEVAGRRLEKLASILVPKSLEERILTSFPMPIAIPYQRFVNARFNIYEQVMRLTDIYESVCFFTYNILLADACRRLDVSKYYVENRKSRTAYNDFSMADRLSFIESIQDSAKSHDRPELFIPELIDGFSVPDAIKLKNDLRNQAAHTATVSEHQQKRVLECFLPIVERMLEKLSFLEKYQMVRISSFYYNNTDLIRRMEVYAGVVPLIDEQVLAEGSELTPADRNHIVLIDQEDNILDLHPIYQLVSSDSTKFEPHISYLKQRMGGDKNRLEGESIPGAFNLDLEGFDDFEQIRTNLQVRT